MSISLSHKKVLILAAHGVDETDMSTLMRTLLSAGAKPVVASVEQGVLNSWSENTWGCCFPVDKHVSSILSFEYDVLIVPGGERSVAKLMQNPHVDRVVTGFFDAGKAVASMGAGVELLANLKHIAGLTVSGVPTSKTVVEAEGVVWSDEAISIDGYVLTGDSLQDRQALLAAVVDHIAHIEPLVQNAA